MFASGRPSVRVGWTVPGLLSAVVEVGSPDARADVRSFEAFFFTHVPAFPSGVERLLALAETRERLFELDAELADLLDIGLLRLEGGVR